MKELGDALVMGIKLIAICTYTDSTSYKVTLTVALTVAPREGRNGDGTAWAPRGHRVR